MKAMKAGNCADVFIPTFNAGDKNPCELLKEAGAGLPFFYGRHMASIQPRLEHVSRPAIAGSSGPRDNQNCQNSKNQCNNPRWLLRTKKQTQGDS